MSRHDGGTGESGNASAKRTFINDSIGAVRSSTRFDQTGCGIDQCGNVSARRANVIAW